MSRKKHRKYSSMERLRLRNRVFRITCSEYWIDYVMAAMEKAGLSPEADHLRRLLARKGIYPPPVEEHHTGHRECWCAQCRGQRSFPAYYAPLAISFEDFLNRQNVDEEAIQDEGLREELQRLRGHSPGVVVDEVRRRQDERQN